MTNSIQLLEAYRTELQAMVAEGMVSQGKANNMAEGFVRGTEGVRWAEYLETQKELVNDSIITATVANDRMSGLKAFLDSSEGAN